jgi:hypothetical protein
MNRFSFIIICTMSWWASPAWSTGLSTSFVDVVARNVPLGTTYRVTEAPGNGLLLWNPGDDPIIVNIQVLTPTDEQLRRGAAPIVDPSWVTIQPSSFTLLGHAHQRCDVILNIPNDRHYRKKHYQVMVWSRGSPQDARGFTLSAGVLSRLRIRTRKR